MFYESRIYIPMETSGPADAAAILKGNKPPRYYALTYQTPQGIIWLVCDSHADSDGFFETAVILDNGKEKRQIESITVGWVKSETELAAMLERAVAEPFDMGLASLNLEAPADNATAWFTCGCCGSSFKGNVKEQIKFDQDEGYGICPSCTQYYK